MEERIAKIEKHLDRLPAVEARLDYLLSQHCQHCTPKKPNAIMVWLILPVMAFILGGKF